VSLHIPATDQTRKSIGYDLFTAMPKGGAIINTARKEVIDEAGLMRAMMERLDLKYATDVAPDCVSKLYETVGNERFFATPKKIGAETAEANINAGLAAARQIVAFLEQGDKRFQVN
jgi:D-3-phosphoglycerate dehydrogenase